MEWAELKRKPTIDDLITFRKLSVLVNYMNKRFLPFSLIIKEVFKEGIIEEKDRDNLFVAFSRVTMHIGLFENRFLPSDQSYTGRDRWEYKLKSGITKDKFEEKLIKYAEKHFKVKVFPEQMATNQLRLF